LKLPFNKSERAGNKLYVVGITLVATLGGLLFGYDTAVVNGAEKSLVDMFISPALKTGNYEYTFQLITQYRILVFIVLYVVGLVISGQIIRLTGNNKGMYFSSVIYPATCKNHCKSHIFFYWLNLYNKL